MEKGSGGRQGQKWETTGERGKIWTRARKSKLLVCLRRVNEQQRRVQREVKRAKVKESERVRFRKRTREREGSKGTVLRK